MGMLPIYKIAIDENDELSGFTANSMVDMPAHGKGWHAFNKQQKLAFNEEQRIVMGVAISVNTPIYRNGYGDVPDHFVLFDRKTTEQIAIKAFKTGSINTINRMHNEDDVYSGVTLFQSFIVDRKLGINPPDAFAAQNLQDGSWILAYKVENDKAWADIKSGKFVGFSIEGYFDIKEANVKNKNKMSKEKKSLFDTLFGKQEEPTVEQKTFVTATTTDGVEVFWDGDLSEGTAVFIEVDGEQVPAPEGMHSIAPGELFPFGVVIEVDLNGIVISMEEPTAEEELQADLEQTLTEMSKRFASELSAQRESFEQTIAKLEAKIDSLTTQQSKFEKEGNKIWQKAKK